MSAQADPETVTPASERIRVNVLAFASPTTTRYLAFLAALLTAGLFVGSWVYNQTQGRDWVRVVVGCAGQAVQATLRRTAPPPAGRPDLARLALEASCRGAAERERAAYALGGMGAVAAGGLIVVYLAPAVVRRRRRLRKMGAQLEPATDRFAVLAAEAGLRSTPRVERGSAAQRDAFSYGAPGRPCVVLPPAVAVRWRDPELFDPLVRHELAHVRHRDVALAWLARSVWYAMAPLLALPLVVALLSSDRSILGDLLWRSSLLGLAVLLVSASLLRSREHDADLRAAQMAGETESLIAVLSRMPARARRGRLRQLGARHPAPRERIEVLQNPERVAGLALLDGFTPAYLAAVLFPLVVNVLVVMFTGAHQTDLAELVAALLAGLLLGGSVGVGLWRRAVVGRIAAVDGRVGAVAAGVALGLVTGQITSLAGTGLSATGGLHHPAWLAISAALGYGATVLSAGFGQLWAEALPRTPRRMAVAAAVVINGSIFAAALWIGVRLQSLLDDPGVTFGRGWLVTVLPSTDLVIGTVVVLALSAGWALWARSGQHAAPAWLIEHGTPPAWPSGTLRARRWVIAALVSGIIAEGSLVAFHFIAGPPTTLAIQAQRYYLYIWVVAAAAGTCTLALCRMDGVRGAGLACLAAPLATLTAVAGFLVVNTALGGHLSGQFALTVARAPLALGLLFCLIAAPAALMPPTSRSPVLRARARPFSAWLFPAICTLAVSALLITGRDAIVGPAATLLSANSSASYAVTTARLDGLRYLDSTAPAITAAYSTVQPWIAAAAAAPTLSRAAALIRDQVLPRLRLVLLQAEAVRPGTVQLASIHDACLASFRDAIIGYTLIAAAIKSGDASTLSQAKLVLRAAKAEWAKWQAGLGYLVLGDGIPVTPADFGLTSG